VEAEPWPQSGYSRLNKRIAQRTYHPEMVYRDRIQPHAVAASFPLRPSFPSN
jgi:hypothetical protein